MRLTDTNVLLYAVSRLPEEVHKPPATVTCGGSRA